jgi:hypothetical protein
MASTTGLVLAVIHGSFSGARDGKLGVTILASRGGSR